MFWLLSFLSKSQSVSHCGAFKGHLYFPLSAFMTSVRLVFRSFTRRCFMWSSLDLSYVELVDLFKSMV